MTAETLTELIGDDTVVDLTLLLAEDLPCTWPGHVWYQHKTFSWFTDRADRAASLVNRNGVAYQTRWLAVDEHTGTHLDAPSHFIPPIDSGLANAGTAGDTCLEQVPLCQSMGPAAMVDVSELDGDADPGVSPAITAERLQGWEQSNGRLGAGDIVLFRSGWDRYYQRGAAGARYGWDVLITGKQPGWPAPDPECVEFLHQRGVRCVGTDGLSVGPAQDGAPTHLAGLSHGMVFIEALTNLGRLPVRGAYFIMLPLRIEEGTGGPGRAIAVVPAPLKAEGGPDPNPG